MKQRSEYDRYHPSPSEEILGLMTGIKKSNISIDDAVGALKIWMVNHLSDSELERLEARDPLWELDKSGTVSEAFYVEWAKRVKDGQFLEPVDGANYQEKHVDIALSAEKIEDRILSLGLQYNELMDKCSMLNRHKISLKESGSHEFFTHDSAQSAIARLGCDEVKDRLPRGLHCRDWVLSKVDISSNYYFFASERMHIDKLVNKLANVCRNKEDLNCVEVGIIHRLSEKLKDFRDEIFRVGLLSELINCIEPEDDALTKIFLFRNIEMLKESESKKSEIELLNI